MHGKDGVVEVGQVDALSLGNEPEEMAVAVERPGEPLLDHVEVGLAVPVEKLRVDEASGRHLVGQLDGGVRRTT